MIAIDRETRLASLIIESHALVDQAIDEHITASGHELAGVVVLFSGGNDSTALAHLMRGRATHAAHANTSIGIEQTRQFVRDTCKAWDLPLLEFSPSPGNTYRELVLDQAFPGPAHHFKMYQRLKERQLRKVRAELVKNPRKQRVLFIAGRRREESERRTNIIEMERVGSTVWVSPLVNWTKLDLNTYRMKHPDMPHNEVTDLLHMSGECLCGAFAHKGELDEIGMWYPDVKAEINALELMVAATGRFPAQKCKWGWGADRSLKASKTGALCSSCDFRREASNA